MKVHHAIRVGDIVRPKKCYSFGYGLYHFYKVVFCSGRYFFCLPLFNDFSPVSRDYVRLPVSFFNFYR